MAVRIRTAALDDAPRRRRLTAVAAAAALTATATAGAVSSAEDARGATAHACMSSVSREPFGRAPSGRQVYRFSLRDGHGLAMQVLTFGGVVQRLRVPDRHGRKDDVVLGFRRVRAYAADTDPYFGALIGRYGNRIARGRFTLDGTTYHLPINNPPNSLHGGNTGFDDRVWTGRAVRHGCRVGVQLRLLSRDGDQGYPGNLHARVTYLLRGDRSVLVRYRAVTDAPTVVNLTQHSYFNLSGEGSGTIYGHRLWVNARRFTPVDETLIPTGRLARVAGTPFDFRRRKPIGRDIRDATRQLRFGQGYDHNFVLRSGRRTHLAARVYDPTSGRVLTILTDQPGLQFYSGNFLDGTLVGKSGRSYRQGDGLALETQHFPDSPNHPRFPPTVLRPGEVYRTHTIWRFSTR
jgi:aldose 1-epimerase